MLALPPRHDRKPWFESHAARLPVPPTIGLNPQICEMMESFTERMRRGRRRSRHYGLVHGDLHAGRFLYEAGGIELTDFGLGVYGWRAMDFATLLFVHYGLPSTRVDDASPARARDVLAAMVRGYRREYGLGEEQLSAINDMMKLRSILDYLTMVAAPDRWKAAHGHSRTPIGESVAWIEQLWTNALRFEIDVRGI